MNFKPNRVFRILLLGAFTLLLLFYFGAPYILIKPVRANCNVPYPETQLFSAEFSILCTDSLTLVGRRTHVRNSKGAMILVHGIGACKEQFIHRAETLSKQGIECFFFDVRAHGKSGGDYITYGEKEKHDIACIVDYIKVEQANVKIGIWGNSMGGAIAIQALEHDKRIEFGIIESTFSRLDDISFAYMKRWLFGFGVRWLSDLALHRAGNIAEFDPFSINPEESVSNIEQPILFVHGTADKSINHTQATNLYTKCKSDKKALFVVEGAGHNNLNEIGGSSYRLKCASFIANQLR